MIDKLIALGFKRHDYQGRTAIMHHDDADLTLTVPLILEFVPKIYVLGMKRQLDNFGLEKIEDIADFL